MAGLGLTQALQGYQRGVEWKQGQDQYARQLQQQQSIDEANKAATGVIDQSKAEWAMNGAQGQYKPSNDTMFKAAEARGSALAKAGLWDQFVENEAKVAPMRIRTRAEALQQYEMDGDPEKLARTVYPTLFDGKTIVGSEKIEGSGSVPSFLKLKLSDGSTQKIHADDLIKNIKLSLTDPAVAAKNEAMLNLERAKAEIESGKQIKVEGFKAKNAQALEEAKSKSAMGLAGFNNEASQKRVDTTAGATRYSADRRVEAAGLSSARSGGGAPRGDDGLTPTERTNQQRAESVDRRAAISNLRAQLNDSRKLLGDTRDPTMKAELEAEVKRLKSELSSEEANFKRLRAGNAGLSSATSSGGSSSEPVNSTGALEMARGEAVNSGQPVDFNLGGKKGRVGADGGLYDAGSKQGAKAGKMTMSDLPKGSKQIGTSKGRPVYETPDGKRFIGN